MTSLSYAALWAEHQPAARRTALALVPPHVADDIVSEAFARVLAACQRRGPPREFRPYLLRAVRNLAADYQVQAHRMISVPYPEVLGASPAAGDQVVRAEELERRLRVDEHGAGVRERREQDREADRQDEEERARHRR